MRNTGTLIATAIAALTLSLASAQAGNRANGTQINGWTANGIQTNGWTGNGTQINGWTSNGVSSSGRQDRPNGEGRKDRSIEPSESALRVIGIELPR